MSLDSEEQPAVATVRAGLRGGRHVNVSWEGAGKRETVGVRGSIAAVSGWLHHQGAAMTRRPVGTPDGSRATSARDNRRLRALSRLPLSVYAALCATRCEACDARLVLAHRGAGALLLRGARSSADLLLTALITSSPSLDVQPFREGWQALLVGGRGGILQQKCGVTAPGVIGPWKIMLHNPDLPGTVQQAVPPLTGCAGDVARVVVALVRLSFVIHPALRLHRRARAADSIHQPGDLVEQLDFMIGDRKLAIVVLRR